LDEFPGRGPTVRDYSDVNRLKLRMDASEKFFDEQFPNRYLTVTDESGSYIHSFFSELEQKNMPNTCDLMIIDGRLHQESMLHAVAALEFHFHPDSHAVLWYVPDEMVRATLSIENIDNLTTIRRARLLAAFGSPEARRTEMLQGKLAYLEFTDGAQRLEGAEYPHGMVAALAKNHQS